MSVLDEKPIHRVRNPVYEVSLSVYPVSVCGEDLQKGSPVVVSSKGEDLYDLRSKVVSLILSTECIGRCFVEELDTKDGKYHDHDEWWCVVDQEKKEVVVGGHYEV